MKRHLFRRSNLRQLRTKSLFVRMKGRESFLSCHIVLRLEEVVFCCLTPTSDLILSRAGAGETIQEGLG